MKSKFERELHEHAAQFLAERSLLCGTEIEDCEKCEIDWRYSEDDHNTTTRSMVYPTPEIYKRAHEILAGMLASYKTPA